MSDVLALALHLNRAAFVARFPEAILVGDGTLVPPPSPMTMTMVPALSFEDATHIARKGASALPTALVCPVRKSKAGPREVINLGRGADNDILLPDESVSKAHASFYRTERGLTLGDRGSTNGTWVSERRLTRGEAATPVTPGTRLRFGMVALTLVDSGHLWDRIRAPLFEG